MITLRLWLLGLLAVVGCAGCIADAPIVAQTPQNANQITSCQTDAVEHNAFVLGGVVISAGAMSIGGVGALSQGNPGLQQALGITSAIMAGVSAIAAGGAGLTGAAFSNGNCGQVVGALPAGAKP